MRPLRRTVQMIYQDPYESLDPRFRVRETIEEPMQVHGIGSSRAQRQELIVAALERAGLSPAQAYLDRYPHELSGGQRQRVAIAAALVLRPALLLADEPVSMLDVSVRAGVLSLLDTLRQDGDMGILMITHDLSTAAHFADRIAVMYLGRVVEQGPAPRSSATPSTPTPRRCSRWCPSATRGSGRRRRSSPARPRTRSICRRAAGFIRAARSPWSGAGPRTRRWGLRLARPALRTRSRACWPDHPARLGGAGQGGDGEHAQGRQVVAAFLDQDRRARAASGGLPPGSPPR